VRGVPRQALVAHVNARVREGTLVGMQPLRRGPFFTWLCVAMLVGAFLVPSSAAADAFSTWTPGPGAALDSTYDGYIDLPTANATVPNGGFTVAGWFVDKTAQGWAGADDVQVWQGTMDGSGKMLAKAVFAQSRPDVAAATGYPFWAASGFGATVPAGALSAGGQALSVYAHTPGKGWWYKQVQVTVSTSAPASPAPVSPAPGAAAPAPTVSGGALPIVVIIAPKSGENIGTHTLYSMRGYALDRNSGPYQGVQGTGIDHVSVYVDKQRDDGGILLGDAELAFSEPVASGLYGPQFDTAGWRLTFKPTVLHSGNHTIYVYAHSVVTGKEDLAQGSMNIIEN
jgi:hypothetical protein